MSLHGRHLLLPGCQHLVEGVPANGRSVGVQTGRHETENNQVLQSWKYFREADQPGRQATNSLDAVHPFLLFFGGLGRDAVEGVVALHDPSISFRLARFYHLVFVVGNEKLKAVLQVWIRQRVKKCP